MSVIQRRRPWCAGLIIGAIAALPVFANTSESGLRIRHFERMQTLEPLTQAVRDSDERPLSMRFRAYGRDFHLRLQPNERLALAAAGSSVGLFAGVVEGRPNSWARISITSGTARGMFWDGVELFLIDSMKILDAASAASLDAGDTVVYRLADTIGGRDPVNATYRELRDELNGGAVQLPAASYRIDVAALGDAAFRARYATDEQAREEILTRLNNVDGIFVAQLGVAIQVSSIDTGASATAGLSDSTNASQLLSQLAGLRMRQADRQSQAITFLFTGRRLDDSRVGLAYTRTLCSPYFSTGLARASVNSGLDSLIAAHEIAHILGAPHDGEKQCTGTPRSRFLMTPALISSESVFSECSLANMRPALHSASCVVELNDGPFPSDRALAAAAAVPVEPAAAEVHAEDAATDDAR
ncbi:MAG TPA: M12 family metallo-peptidase [Povalibacter sp.]|uniref:M12 family metallo-peptidase n=1 Tax=Povalibacter sp. TaxID=1962978 RepID=UPI002CD24C70|nr:M12 family metallo-peptidase [Povalibacter sp.]HMN46471.1 M12 family metallo-peptidase [Povalibacter sp.]